MTIFDQNTFENAKADIDKIGESINQKKIVNPRLGSPFKSIPLVVEEAEQQAANALQALSLEAELAVEDVINHNMTRGFATEALLKQWIPDFNGARAKADDTKSIYRYDESFPINERWVNTGLSDKDQAIAYTDSALTDIDSTAFNTLGFVDNTGKSQTSGSFKRTDFIPVLPNLEYRIFSRLTGSARHAWYDANKVFISAFGDDQTVNSEKVVTAPTNAAFLIVSAYLEQTWSIAYIKSKAYDIDELKKVMQLHAPNFDSSKINYNNTDVKVTLDKIVQNQSLILQNQSNIESTLDLQSDKSEPFFVNNWHFVKVTNSVSAENALKIANVTAKTANTVTIDDVSIVRENAGLVLFDQTANSYTSHAILKIDSNVITLSGTLPINPTKAQSLHDAENGQHLTLFGTKAHAQYVVEQLQKYSYKKTDNRLFVFNPAKCAYKAWNDADIYNADESGVATTLLATVTKLGTANNGGWITGTTNLAKACAMSATLSAGVTLSCQYTSKAYILTDTVAGNGFEFSFDGGQANGFLEIPIAARNAAYTATDNTAQVTSGRARLEVFADDISIFDKTYNVGQLEFAYVDFLAASKIKIRVTCADSVPTSIYLSGVFAYKKSAKTSKDSFFKSGDVIAFLGDSWTQYPIASTIGESGQTRPDGSVSTGSQWLSRFMQEKLAERGVNVTMLNMGFGGQTSMWGKYWVSTILNLSPRPTHCILSFYINDNNSIGGTNTVYDFDPESMFVNKPEPSGGLRGRLESADEWEANMKYICETLANSNIKPIILMPGQTASVSQTQLIRSRMLDRIVDGFN